MGTTIKGYAALEAGATLEPFSFERRPVGADDVLIRIGYCGVCHSDIHQVRNEWGGSIFPMVPGHEIVGTVTKIGTGVKKFREGGDGRGGVFCRLVSRLSGVHSGIGAIL